MPSRRSTWPRWTRLPAIRSASICLCFVGVSLETDPLDQVYADAKTRDLPLLFVDGQFVGTQEDVQYKEESEQLNAILGV